MAYNYYPPQSYLEHHGIKGQKWGQRRFQNSDGSLTAQGRQRYGVLERTKIRAQGFGERVVTPFKKASQAKGFGNKFSELAGYGQLKTSSEIRAKTQKRLSDASRTRLGKRIHDWSSANNQYSADYAKTMRKKDMSDKFIEQFVFKSEWLKQPHQRISGRTTTNGKQFVDTLLTGGAVGAAKDISYLSAKSKNRKNDKYSAKRGKLTVDDKVSKTTKNVVNDWNNMNNEQFMSKYHADKKTYAKRVDKYGDPYMNSPLAKAGKALSKKRK